MRAAVLLATLLIASGCLSQAPRSDAPQEERRPQAPASEPPPGCDASRPAIAHGPAGARRSAPVAPPLPCGFYPGGGSGEPTLGVCPEGGAVYVYPLVGDPLLGPSTSPPNGGRVGVTEDGGRTWRLRAVEVGGRNVHERSQDPYFYLDPATCRLFVDDLQTANCSLLSLSDDGGASWMSSLAGCAEFDHQTIFAGPPVRSSTAGYPNLVYRCAVNLVALHGFSTASTRMKSLDGGLSFSPTGAPAFTTPAEDLPGRCDGLLGHGMADAAGRVYLPKGWCGQPWLAISPDEGLTWTRVQVAANGMSRDAGVASHEAAVAEDVAGNLFYLWVAEDRLPYLAVSRDRGASWGAPMMVAAPDVKEASLPTLAAAGPGKVAFAYLGSTNSPGPPFPEGTCEGPTGCVLGPPRAPQYEDVTWNAYLGVTVEALASEPTFLSASINDPADPLVRGTCGATRCQQVGDFIDIGIGPDGTPWAALVDACIGECASGAASNNASDALVGRLVGGPSLR